MGHQHFLFVLVFLFVCLSVFVLFCLVPLPVRWFNLLDIEFCLVIEKTTKMKIWAVPISGFRKIIWADVGRLDFFHVSFFLFFFIPIHDLMFKLSYKKHNVQEKWTFVLKNKITW